MAMDDEMRLGRRAKKAVHAAPENEGVVSENAGLLYDVLMGNLDLNSPQYGVVGKTISTEEHERERVVAFDFNHVHCLGIFGQPGGGKSYTMGTIMEMVSQYCPNINELPSPLCTMMFHYSASEVSEPEFVSVGAPNSNPVELDLLKKGFDALPKGVDDVLVLAPAEAVARRRKEFPHLQVEPLVFHPQELQTPQWKILMGAVGEQSMYLQVMKMAMKSCNAYLNTAAVRREVMESELSQHEKDVAGIRLDLLDQYIDVDGGIMRWCKPGRMIIVDMRDEYLEKDEILSILMVLMQVFGDAKYRTDDEWAEYFGGEDIEANQTIDAKEQEWNNLFQQRKRLQALSGGTEQGAVGAANSLVAGLKMAILQILLLLGFAKDAIAQAIQEAEHENVAAQRALEIEGYTTRMRELMVELRDLYAQKAADALEKLQGEKKETGEKVNKLVVYDEAHKFMQNEALVATLIESIREMRHKACSIMIASQDPPSVPAPILELSTHLIMHRMTAPNWLAHLKTVNASLHSLTVGDVATLKTGQAWVWATKASEARYYVAPTKIQFRTRFSQHGGATKTAVKGTETKGV